jgi:hypothetical protein
MMVYSTVFLMYFELLFCTAEALFANFMFSRFLGRKANIHMGFYVAATVIISIAVFSLTLFGVNTTIYAFFIGTILYLIFCIVMFEKGIKEKLLVVFFFFFFIAISDIFVTTLVTLSQQSGDWYAITEPTTERIIVGIISKPLSFVCILAFCNL